MHSLMKDCCWAASFDFIKPLNMPLSWGHVTSVSVITSVSLRRSGFRARLLALLTSAVDPKLDSAPSNCGLKRHVSQFVRY
jgi:hypothetical protein